MEEQKEDFSLINKIVKVVDNSSGVDCNGIVPFMYPDFLVKDDIFFDYENNIIYTGKFSQNIKEVLEHGTKQFIAICDGGVPDIDLTDRESAIGVLYAKRNRKVGESTKEALLNMSEYEFWNYFKKYWVVGRSKIEDKKVSLFEMYNVLGGQRHDILKKYFELREVYSDSTIFSSVLGFIEKSLNPDRVSSTSGKYIGMLKKFRENWGGKAQKAVQGAYITECRSDQDRQYRTITLLMQLGKGEIV